MFVPSPAAIAVAFRLIALLMRLLRALDEAKADDAAPEARDAIHALIHRLEDAIAGTNHVPAEAPPAAAPGLGPVPLPRPYRAIVRPIPQVRSARARPARLENRTSRATSSYDHFVPLT